MHKILDYRIIEGIASNTTPHHKEQFCDKIRLAIKEGWQPIGGVTIMDHRGNMIKFCQAMVMYEK